MVEIFRRAKLEEEEREAELAAPAAVREREDSLRAYANLSPAQSEQLLVVSFPAFLASLNADPARTLSDSRLDLNLGEGDAVVTTEGETQLLEGSYPVETQNDEGGLEKVDVTLEETAEGYEAENPLVEVAIADSVAEGVLIGGEGSVGEMPPIAVTQIGAEESTARALGDKNAFFGEVEPGSDTDLLVSPTAYGVELANLLRTVDSPEVLRFHVDLPAGSELRAEQGGGAEVVAADGSLLYRVDRPVSFDAQGSSVATTLEVEGDNLVVHVPHRKADVAYPILVDPELETNWNQGNLPGIAPNGPWVPHASAANNGISYGTSDTYWPGLPGLYFAAQEGFLGANVWTDFAYFSPNENSYIARAVINIFHRGDFCSPLVKDPYDYTGMFAWNNGGTPETPHWNGYRNNDAYNYGNSEINSWGNEFIIGYGNATARWNPCWRNVRIGGTQIWLNDWQYPVLTSVGATPEGWVKKDGSPRTFSVTARDEGLGVRRVRAFGSGTQDWDWERKPCAGTYEDRCPTLASSQITFKTEGFPLEGRYNGEGKERKFSVQVIDPTDKRWVLERPLWVDGTPPVLSLEGQLASATDQVGTTEKSQETNAKDDELSLPTYNLHISADDGVDRSGVKEVKVFLDKDPSKEPGAAPTEIKSVSCPFSGCERTMSMDYTLRLPGLAAGKHSLWVVAVDKVGNSTDLNRNIEFEYIPATGMTDEFVLQHFRLPDGNDYSGEAEYHGPEIAVNVMNGNVVYHERDVDFHADRGRLELERIYNSQQPVQKDTQWGRGWSIAQSPELELQSGPTPPQKATVTRTGRITRSVPIPTAQSQTTFSSRLHASITKTGSSGYRVKPVSESEVEVFNSSGRIEEVVLGDDTPVYLAPEEAEPLPAGPATYVSSFGTFGTGDGQFDRPGGLDMAPDGTLWVADSVNDRVLHFGTEGEYLGKLGSPGEGNGQLDKPVDVEVDATGNLFVADANNDRIQKFSSAGAYLSQFGGFGSANGQFKRPEGLAIDQQGRIWVADAGNNRIQKFSAAGVFEKAIGSAGSGEGQLYEPMGIDVGPGGNVLVADWDNDRVVVFSEAGSFVRQFGIEGYGDGELRGPVALDVDAEGMVWVSDEKNERIEQFDQSGEYISQFGEEGSADGEMELENPMGILTDADGNVFVTDSGNDRVQRWRVGGEWMPPPLHTSTFGSFGTGDGEFDRPGGVAMAPDGTLWIADSENNRVQHFEADGDYLGQFGSLGEGNGELDRPVDVEIDGAGNIFVADAGNDRVQKFSSSGTFLSKFGTYGTGNGQFRSPEGLAIDAGGNLWVADTVNNRLQKFSPAGSFLKVAGAGGSGQGQLYEPMGIDVGPGGNVLVADWDNNRVVVYNQEGSFVRQFGIEGYDGGQFRNPVALDVDPSGYVWVSDERNERIEQFDQSGDFLSQFGEEGTGEGEMELVNPMGIATDGDGNVFVTDSGNDRVQRWRKLGSGSGPAPYFAPPVVDYGYSEGKLTTLQLEDEATEEEDPALEMALSGGLVSEVASEEIGDTTYGYESGRLKTAVGSDGEAKFGYDAAGRMSSVTLPNGTVATIVYDSTSRATSVKVDPAGPEGAKTTNFFYSAEPRRTTVWGGGNPEITYDIGEDGSVFKWAYAETPPTIASISGSLWSKRGEEIENKDHTLFVTGSSPHQVASIRVVANGNSVIAEKTCEDPAEPPSHVCDQPEPLQLFTHASEHAAGRMDLEVIVTDFLGHQTAERFYVIVPQQPPEDPTAPERPTFKSIKLFREENGLDRMKSLTESQLNEQILELLYDWERRDETAMRAVEEFGVPMRAPELSEMEYRRQYLSQAAEAIPQWAEENAPSTYGGYYVDNRAGGIIYVGFTQEQEAKVAALKGSGVLMATGQVTEMQTPPARSLNSVEATEVSVASVISGNTSALAATSSISVIPDTAMVEVIATDTNLVENVLTSAFGASAPIIVVPDTYPVKPASFSRYHVTGPVRAGDAIQSLPFCKDGNCGWLKLCTANVGGLSQTDVVRGQAVYTWFKLTAGHCFELGGHIRRRANKSGGEIRSVGQVVRSGWVTPNSNGIYSDGEAIEVNSELAGGGIFYGNPHDVIPVKGPERMKLGREYCWSGRNGGRNCGTAFRRRRVRVGNKLAIEMDIKGPSVAGDSGGPVWNPATKKVVGIVSAHGRIQGKPCAPVNDPDKQGAEWCPRTLIMPFVPFANKNYPNGVLSDLGIQYLATGE